MKKQLIPTAILLVVLIAGYAYAKSENFFREEPQVDPVLITLQSDDVQELRLGSEASRIVLKRTEDSWEMTEPAAYPIQQYSVNVVVEAFADVRTKGVVETEPSDLEEFGLGDSAYEVEAVLADGSTKKLLIGNALPVSGSTYVKPADEAAVYEAADTELTSLYKSAEDFLDKSVLKLEYNEVTSIELEWNEEKWTLTKTEPDKAAYESAWKLDDKELKPEEGSGILDQLTFLATDRLPRAREEVDLATAEMKLTIKQGEQTAVYNGKIDNQLVRIAKDDGAWAFAVGATDIDDIANGLKELLTAEEQEESGEGAEAGEG